MSTATTAPFDLLRVAAVAGMLLAAADAWRYRENTVAKPFVALATALAIWAGLSLLPGTLGAPKFSGAGGAVLALAQFTAAVVVAPLWLTYVHRYAGRERLATRRSVAKLVAPVAFVVALAITRAVLRDLLPAFAAGAATAAIFVLLVYLVTVFVVGVYLLVRLVRQYQQLSYRQAVTLVTALAAPYVLFAASSVSQPTEGGGTAQVLPVDVTFVGFLVAAPLLMYAVRRYPLFTAFPESDQIARDEVVAELTEAVVLLNENDNIIDANSAAARLLPDDDTLVGRPAGDVLDDVSRLSGDGAERLTLETGDGQRQFEVTSSEVGSRDGVLGRTLLFRDVTRRETRKQQLAVLTRVLRHNLRNDLDATLAYAREVEDPEIRQRLEANIRNLTDTARKARTIEDVLSTAGDSYAPVDVVDVVQSVADDFRADHECEVEVTAPAELVVVSHRRRLVDCLTELVENAVTHGDGSPTVEVRVGVADPEADPARVEFEVADDGPGIPARERHILEDGDESPLQHSAGVGLWLAQWVATSLKGDISFDRREPTGSVVTVGIRATVVNHRGDGA